MSAIVHATDATFEEVVMKAKGPVLVDFWAPWCGPCRTLNPMLEEMAAERAGTLTIVKVNADQNEETMKKFGVRGIPALFMMNQGRLMGTRAGVAPKAELSQWVDDVLAKPPEAGQGMDEIKVVAALENKRQEETVIKVVNRTRKGVYTNMALLQAAGGAILAFSAAATPPVALLGLGVMAYTAVRTAMVLHEDYSTRQQRHKSKMADLIVSGGKHSKLAPQYATTGLRMAGNMAVAASGVALLGLMGASSGLMVPVLAVMGLSAIFKGVAGFAGGGLKMMSYGAMVSNARAESTLAALQNSGSSLQAKKEAAQKILNDPRVQKALAEGLNKAFEKKAAEQDDKVQKPADDVHPSAQDAVTPPPPKKPDTPQP